jgi:hypothetical protein
MKLVLLRHSGHVRVALSTSAKVLPRQLRMHARQKQCSQSINPKQREDGSSFRSTCSKQIEHSICTHVQCDVEVRIEASLDHAHCLSNSCDLFDLFTDVRYWSLNN